MSDSESTIITKWNELKSVIENLEADVIKNAKGVAAAGIRTRKGLRLLQVASRQLVKLTLETDKLNKSEKDAAEETLVTETVETTA